MTEDAHTLSRFLPRYLRRRLADPATQPGEPESWPVRGALLFVDVAGFTAQVDRLAASGPRGAELANELVENSIGQLIGALGRDGGEIVVFAGDGLFALWPTLPEDASPSAAVVRAAHAALQALQASKTGSTDRTVLRFALGAGQFTAHRLGGFGDRWHCLLSGPAFEQVGKANRLARDDALVASSEALDLAAGLLEAEGTDQGASVVRRCLAAPTEPTAIAVEQTLSLDFVYPHLSDAVAQNMDHLDLRWIAEFRRPTVIFLRLPGLIRDGQLDGTLAQFATRRIQQIVKQSEGSTVQFVIDDKGPIFIVAFGLSAGVHEDDPARAAIAALRITEMLSSERIECGIGISTGRAFCGLIGDSDWSCYTLIGNTMNFAARLMQRAQPGPLCDQLTCDLSDRRVEFVAEGPVAVKGLDHPLPHFRIIGEQRDNRPAWNDERAPSPLFGRDAELDILRSQINALSSQRRGSLIAVVGEAGIGKSRLVQQVARTARQEGLTCLFAGGTRNTGAQSRWSSVVRTLLKQLGALAPSRFTRDPFLRHFLGDTDLPLPDVDDAERALRTRQALSGIILSAAESAPLLLCVEDAHWMDSLSWSLVLRLAQENARSETGLMLVLTSREIESNAPPDVLKQLGACGMQRLMLGPLPRADRARIAQSVIGAESLSDRATDWLAQTSGGNPLFCRELAVAAIENGRLQIVNGRADLTAEIDNDDEHSRLPSTLQGLIASRLDRLLPGEQICIRIASVIGSGFALASLLAAHPGDEAEVRPHLERLCELGFLHPAEVDQHEGYVFHHALMRDAAYDSLPYRMRRELHATLAAWMASHPTLSQTSHVATLAYHLERAEKWEAAFGARLRAGQIALSNFANREAANHFQAAREIRSQHPPLRDHVEAWSPELGLSEARHRMGDERASRRHIEEALRAFGEPVPASALGKSIAILRELALRALPAGKRPPAHLRSATRLRTVLRAYNLLPDIVYYDNDPLALTAVTLRFERLSAAERQPSSERSRALAWYALLQGSLGNLRSRDHHFDAALSCASDSNDTVVDAWVRLARGSELAQHGSWDAAEHWLRNALATCERIGDRTRAWNVMSALGHVLAYRGELKASETVLADALQRNRDTDNPLFLAWGSSGHAGALLRMGFPGDSDDVVRILREAREMLTLRPDAAADLFNRGLLAVAMERNGSHHEAFDLARETIEIALEGAPLVWLQVSSYLGLLEVLLSATRNGARQADAMRLLRLMEKSVSRFSRLIPIGKPVLGLIRGHINLIHGRRDRARRDLSQGLRFAAELAMPLETGELHLALAEACEASQAMSHLDHAASTFQRLGAQSRLQVALEQRLSLCSASSTADRTHLPGGE